LEYTLQDWLELDNQAIARIVAPRASTAVIYLNGTRRWFLTQSKDWADYAKITGLAQRQLSQLFYDHGIQTVIQPMLGYDILERGPEYHQLAFVQGLGELGTKDYREWYRRAEIRVTIYGNWLTALTELGFLTTVNLMNELMEETRQHTKHKLVLGVFADEGLDRIVALSKNVKHGEELLGAYYGQPVGAVNLIIGSGQPVIWDLPLLNINKASLYFLQAPTFCLDKNILRRIFYDHLYQRVNDEELDGNVNAQLWQDFEIIGLGNI
jgi:hypothetical protein